MDWQLTISLVVVGLASCYLAWRGWRLWSKKTGSCGSGCASGSPAGSVNEDKRLIAISLEKLAIRYKK